MPNNNSPPKLSVFKLRTPPFHRSHQSSQRPTLLSSRISVVLRWPESGDSSESPGLNSLVRLERAKATQGVGREHSARSATDTHCPVLKERQTNQRRKEEGSPLGFHCPALQAAGDTCEAHSFTFSLLEGLTKEISVHIHTRAHSSFKPLRKMTSRHPSIAGENTGSFCLKHNLVGLTQSSLHATAKRRKRPLKDP